MNKKGRPASKNPASEKIEVRMTPAQKEQLREAAEQCGLSMSAFLLMAGLRETRTQPDGTDNH